ncbi:Fic family protein, partial [Patescibacteria group bacterium]
RDRDVQEVINYRQVLKFIDGLAALKLPKKGSAAKRKQVRSWRYNQTMVKRMHSLVCDRVIETHQQGQYRETQVILRESRTGEVFFRPPPAVEVPYLMGDFISWLNSKKGREIHPILRAGIAHYCLVAIHPFVEGNGRTSRAFATLVLFAEGYDIKRFFSLEEYFDQDANAYYQALFKVSSQDRDLGKRDLSPWLSYFTQVMAVELNRVKERVKNISIDIKIKGRLGAQVPLNERQIRIVEYLEENGQITTRQAKKIIPEYSEDTILRDLNYLLKKGIIFKKGRTKGARYHLKK